MTTGCLFSSALRVSRFLAMLAVAAGCTAGAWAHDHSGYFPGGYVDARSCAVCHKEAIDEVMSSVHYLWRSENPLVEFPGGGAHGMIDRACGLVGSNAIVNYDEHCGRCHVADSLPFADPQTGEYTPEQRFNVDCLICHAEVYDTNNDGVREEAELADERPRVIDTASGREVWHRDRGTEAAESVGERVSKDACLRCHHHGQADYTYKRGTPFEPETDVHAAAGMHCTDCHEVHGHKIARGSKATDMHAWELQDVEVSCEKCHSDAPHETLTALNYHTDRIACETCHIPDAAGALRRVWASTYGVSEGPEANIPIWNPETGKWEPYTEYTEGPVPPAYRWYNGGASMLAEPIANPGNFDMQPATRDTPDAKIYPFRSFISGQPMDALGLPDTPGFNEMFTMRGALEQMAPALKAFGLMRPEGLTDAESAMMGMFPNMLIFDREDYFANGNVSEAVSIGMAKLGGFYMGVDVASMSRPQQIGMGQQMWSGEIASLDLPNNPFDPGYIDDMDPTTATGSFIKISHAIRKDTALNCSDCHTARGRLDFRQLGYDEERAQRLETLFDGGNGHASLIGSEYTGPSQCTSCHEGKFEEMVGSVHYKFESELPEGYQLDHHGDPVTFTRSGKLWKLCGFPTTLPQFNWLGNLRDLPETDHIDNTGGCGKCHVGIGPKPYTANGGTEPAASDMTNVDCLICHAAEYDRKYYTATAGGEPELVNGNPVIMSVPRTDGVLDFSIYTEAAKTVGRTQTDACLRCHAAAGGGTYQADEYNYASFKRGSIYGPGKDVHADAGMTCSDCHYAGGHRMKRPLNNDLSAHDVVVDHQMCTDCHTDQPHDSQAYNNHLDKIACTTCHATTTLGATYKDFSVHIPPDPEDPLDLWKVKLERANLSETPKLHVTWFNGTVGHEIMPLGSRDDGRLYPYKEIQFNQPLDENGHPVPIKWGPFFKAGNMTAALDQGRAAYDALYSEELGAETGIASTAGPFDHYGVNECGGFSISHGITREDALTCAQCHVPSERSRITWEDLGYTAEEIEYLSGLFDDAGSNVWMLF